MGSKYTLGIRLSGSPMDIATVSTALHGVFEVCAEGPDVPVDDRLHERDLVVTVEREPEWKPAIVDGSGGLTQLEALQRGLAE